MKHTCKTLNIFYFAIVFTLISCGAAANAGDNSILKKEIFRYVNLNEGHKIVLGDDFESIKSLTKRKVDKIHLKENLFGFVKSIELIFDSKNKLSEIIFEYNGSKPLKELVDSYIEQFGAPIRKSNTIYWEDKQTRFEILHFLGGRKIFSKMIDLQ
jgi:hypothetical protein